MRSAIKNYLADDKAAGPVMGQAALLLRLNTVFQLSVPSPLGEAARVANFKAGTLIILAENGAVAVKLRQMTQRLESTFSTAGVQCNSVEVKVQPSKIHSESTGSMVKPISASSRESIGGLIQSLPPEDRLRKALEVLLNRSAHHICPKKP